MTKRLPKLAFVCIAFALATAAPVGAQAVRETAVSPQLTWCPDQPTLTALRGLQEGVDLEPHQAAVLAACPDAVTGTVQVLGIYSASVPVASRRDEGWQRGNR